MKKMKNILKIVIVCALFFALESCANARWGTNAGVNVEWGPHGPRVRPHVDFDVYNGGRL